jgi:hypothetical protein
VVGVARGDDRAEAVEAAAQGEDDQHVAGVSGPVGGEGVAGSHGLADRGRDDAEGAGRGCRPEQRAAGQVPGLRAAALGGHGVSPHRASHRARWTGLERIRATT